MRVALSMAGVVLGGALLAAGVAQTGPWELLLVSGAVMMAAGLLHGLAGIRPPATSEVEHSANPGHGAPGRPPAPGPDTGERPDKPAEKPANGGEQQAHAQE